MKEKIKNLDQDIAKDLLTDFMNVYLDKGFGVMNKTEIETLLYHVLKKHNLLTGKCFNDSLFLQIPEAKARKLIYEAQVKYANMDQDALTAYLRKSVGECLTRAFLSKTGKEIKFAIEDKYLRVALNAKLRENNYFADSSFNKDIISLDEEAFREMVLLLVPNVEKDEVLEKLTAIELADEVKNKEAKEIILDIVFEPEVNQIYTGIVTRIMNFGAFVQIANSKEGMIHISKLSDKHIEKVEEVVRVGDKVEVTIIKIDDKGRIDLKLNKILI